VEEGSLGGALKKRVSASETVKVRKQQSDELLFYNDFRVKILQLLVYRPGSSRGELGKRLEMNSSTVAWHVEKMIKGEVLEEHDYNGKGCLFPSHMIPGSDTYKPLCALMGKNNDRFVVEISRSPGITLKELATATSLSQNTVRKGVNELLKEELLSVKRDGRNRRHFISSKLDELLEDSKNWYRVYRSVVTGIIAAEKFQMETDMRRDGELVIRFGTASRGGELVIPNILDIDRSVQ